MSADVPPLIRALLEPHRYPHDSAQVELTQTHLSWLLLAGAHVYKIRKPVKFDFVDFSTLALRREDCEAEVRLNRRFAPTLYEAVVSITGSPQDPAIDGIGPVLEHAVRMRRFPADAELTALLARNDIDAQALMQFGARIAAIHADSAVGDRPAAAMAAVAADNVQELLRVAGSEHQRLAQLQQWLSQQWSRIADTVEERRRAGRIRECHGDLHAGNIVRLDGVLTAFDAITFNERLRCIDVASDVAFLVMDLHARRRADLAWAFLNGWLESSGDYQAMQLLPFAAVHRALVRAKVAALDGDDTQCARYIDVALDGIRAGCPALTITCGLSGSGKTWLSSRAMTQAGAVRIRSDVERKRLAGLRPEESSRGRASIYTVEFNRRVYEHLLDLAGDLLRQGHHVIVDAAFLKRDERLAFMSLAARENARFRIVHCIADTPELRRRLDERQRTRHDASEADAAVMQRQLDYWEPFTASEAAAVIDVNTADDARVGDLLRNLKECSRH